METNLTTQKKKELINRLLREIYQDIKRVYYTPLDDLSSFIIKENGKKYQWIFDILNDYESTEMRRYLHEHPETELPMLRDQITPQDSKQLNLFTNLKTA